MRPRSSRKSWARLTICGRFLVRSRVWRISGSRTARAIRATVQAISVRGESRSGGTEFRGEGRDRVVDARQLVERGEEDHAERAVGRIGAEARTIDDEHAGLSQEAEHE